ncbi:sensor histidine kinase [Sphingomonas suaedae]|nr:HAMP domain-containing sensor histidine kinase [Sphingomonas suaedae]
MISGKRLSIAAPIFLLMILSVIVATLVMFVVTFRGPPPQSGPVSVAQIARALRGGPLPESGLPLELRQQREAPLNLPRNHEVPAGRAALAKAMKVPESRVRLWAMKSQRRADELHGPFVATYRTADGWRIVRTPSPALFTRWHKATLVAMAAAVLVLGGLGWALAGAISRPIRRLGEAAARSRLGMPVDIPRGGPREVDALAVSLAAMQDRLAEGVEGRTAMLAAIAHDLGTPLARIAFWVEQLPDPARERASADIDEMRAMLQAALRFARDERIGEARVKVEIGSLVEALAEDMAATGAPVETAGGPRAVVRGDPAALRRMLTNLVENAVRYGNGATIGWTIEAGSVELHIDDSGPGFDPAKAASLFTPFVRGDPSRNRATGGTGLGLAIARSIAQAHGGEIALGNHPGGGRVTIRLPQD